MRSKWKYQMTDDTWKYSCLSNSGALWSIAQLTFWRLSQLHKYKSPLKFSRIQSNDELLCVCLLWKLIHKQTRKYLQRRVVVKVRSNNFIYCRDMRGYKKRESTWVFFRGNFPLLVETAEQKIMTCREFTQRRVKTQRKRSKWNNRDVNSIWICGLCVSFSRSHRQTMRQQSKNKICYLFRVCSTTKQPSGKIKKNFLLCYCLLRVEALWKMFVIYLTREGGKIINSTFHVCEECGAMNFGISWVMLPKQCRNWSDDNEFDWSFNKYKCLFEIRMESSKFIISCPWSWNWPKKPLVIRLKAHLEVYDANERNRKNENRSSMKKTLFEFYSIAIDR